MHLCERHTHARTHIKTHLASYHAQGQRVVPSLAVIHTTVCRTLPGYITCPNDHRYIGDSQGAFLVTAADRRGQANAKVTSYGKQQKTARPKLCSQPGARVPLISAANHESILGTRLQCMRTACGLYLTRCTSVRKRVLLKVMTHSLRIDGRESHANAAWEWHMHGNANVANRTAHACAGSRRAAYHAACCTCA